MTKIDLVYIVDLDQEIVIRCNKDTIDRVKKAMEGEFRYIDRILELKVPEHLHYTTALIRS
jgi:hypothetical protein